MADFGLSGQLGRKHYLALLLLCLAFFLPGQMALPPTDRDESRFAQASKQMVESGNYTDIRFQDEPRYKKPIGIYWLQSASANALHALTGASLNSIWLYRLPSLLAAIGSVLLTAAIGARLFTPAIGLLAGLLLASSLLLNVEARLAKTDAVLLLTVLSAQYGLISIWLRRTTDKYHAALFWLAMGAGVLVKGPIILLPVLPVLLTLCWRERSGKLWRDLQPHWGILLFLLVVLPWFVAITLKGGSAFWQASAGQDLAAKLTGGRESHGLPPGFYLATGWLTFWPGSIFVFLALPFVWRHRRQEKIQLLLAWLLPTWLAFEAVPTKLLHYTLPAFPALALLAAAAWQLGPQPFRWRLAAPLGWLAWVILSLAVIIGLAVLPSLHGPVAFWQCIAGTLALTGLLWWLVRGRMLPPVPRIGAVALVALLLFAPLFALTLPGWRNIWIAPQVQAAIDGSRRDCPQMQLVSAAFNEPSLVFLNGTDTMLNARGAAAAGWLLARPLGINALCRYALVDAKEWPAFTDRLRAVQATMDQVTQIDGFNYSSGQPVSLQLVRIQP